MIIFINNKLIVLNKYKKCISFILYIKKHYLIIITIFQNNIFNNYNIIRDEDNSRTHPTLPTGHKRPQRETAGPAWQQDQSHLEPRSHSGFLRVYRHERQRDQEVRQLLLPLTTYLTHHRQQPYLQAY